MAQRPDRSPKCSSCGEPILGGDLALRDHGDWYHVGCARSLTADEPAREVRGLPPASEARMAQSRERPVRSPGAPDEAPAVLCVTCGTGIGSMAEMTVTGAGPTHVRCLPAQSN